MKTVWRICDRHQILLCRSLWNEQDPILKERLFGLTGNEGNHGEDVKEYYFYLDNTPTHSYMKYLYKYPQAEFPYGAWSRRTGGAAKPSRNSSCMDTGIFDEDRYFDVFVEYAKAAVEDILIRITVANRGPERRNFTCCRRCGSAIRGLGANEHAGLHLTGERFRRSTIELEASCSSASAGCTARARRNCCSPRMKPTRSGSSASPNRTPYVKDGINDYVVHGGKDAVNPEQLAPKPRRTTN